MLLKRVIGLEGEQVAFQAGQLFINGQKVSEPHVQTVYHGNLLPRTVEKGNVYLVGDGDHTVFVSGNDGTRQPSAS